MNRPEPTDRLRYALAWSDAGNAASGCLDDGTIAALADGTIDQETRAATLQHLSSCRRCRHAVASVARALRDPLVAREVAAFGAIRRRRIFRIAAPLAAAAALLLFVWPGRNPGDPAHRDPTLTGAATPTLVTPVGRVSDVEDLRWTAVPGSDRYRVTLFDASGSVLYETQLADTVVAIPDSIAFVSGRSYFWKVEARGGFDRWSASDLVEFSVAGRGR